MAENPIALERALAGARERTATKTNAIGRTREDRRLDWVINILVILVGLIAFYPLYIVVISSISDPTYISSGQAWLFPRGINVEAYRKLLSTRLLWVGYRNTLFYTVVGTSIQMAVTTSAGFALSRKTLPFRRPLILFFLFTMYFSGGLIPTYLVIRSLGMVNTIWALLLPGALGTYNLIISRTYFENSIPEEIYESATIDGASMFRCFAQFAIPLAVPVLAVMVLYFALGHWNSYFGPMIYISDESKQVLQVFIKRIAAEAVTTLESSDTALNLELVVKQMRESQLIKYAVIIVSSIPMIVLYPFIQKFLIQGVMIGAVKG